MEGLVHSKEGLISIARHSLFCVPEYQQDQRERTFQLLYFSGPVLEILQKKKDPTI